MQIGAKITHRSRKSHSMIHSFPGTASDPLTDADAPDELTPPPQSLPAEDATHLKGDPS